MIREAIKKLVDKRDLTEEEIMGAMNCIMDGSATHAQIGSFITALRLKGETTHEITGCARIMRDKANRIFPQVDYMIDTCGTGGAYSGTFNISTAVAVIAAAGGVKVAKHGNRSVSSKSGSADVLEALGVNISLSPGQVKECIEKIGIGFLYAPGFHSSMKHAAGPRKELGIRTIFNILGPLTNPACVKGQLLGVYDEKLTEPVAKALMSLGVEKAMVVHGMDGLDEITTTHVTKVSEIRNGKIANYLIDPLEFNIKRSTMSLLKGGNADDNAEIIRSVLEGKPGPHRDVVLLNAGAALYVGKACINMRKGVQLAAEIIDSGMARRKLEELIEYTNSVAELRGDQSVSN